MTRLNDIVRKKINARITSDTQLAFISRVSPLTQKGEIKSCALFFVVYVDIGIFRSKFIVSEVFTFQCAMLLWLFLGRIWNCLFYVVYTIVYSVNTGSESFLRKYDTSCINTQMYLHLIPETQEISRMER